MSISPGYRVLDEEVVEWNFEVENIRYTIVICTHSNLIPFLQNFYLYFFLQLDEPRPPNASLNNDNNSQVPVTDRTWMEKSGKNRISTNKHSVAARARELEKKRRKEQKKTQNHYRKFTIPHNDVVNKPFIVSSLNRQSATSETCKAKAKSVHTWWLHIQSHNGIEQINK